jgi:hypothetical protein
MPLLVGVECCAAVEVQHRICGCHVAQAIEVEREACTVIRLGHHTMCLCALILGNREMCFILCEALAGSGQWCTQTMPGLSDRIQFGLVLYTAVTDVLWRYIACGACCADDWNRHHALRLDSCPAGSQTAALWQHLQHSSGAIVLYVGWWRCVQDGVAVFAWRRWLPWRCLQGVDVRQQRDLCSAALQAGLCGVRRWVLLCEGCEVVLLLLVLLPESGLSTPKVHLQGSACNDPPWCVQFVLPAIIIGLLCVYACLLTSSIAQAWELLDVCSASYLPMVDVSFADSLLVTADGWLGMPCHALGWCTAI